MASNRIGRINDEIRKELSELLRNLKDPRVQGTLISITPQGVEVCFRLSAPGAGTEPAASLYTGAGMGAG